MPEPSELKPCPFCGGQCGFEGPYYLGSAHFTAGCGACSIRTEKYQGQNGAFAWNRRAYPPEVERLVEAADGLLYSLRPMEHPMERTDKETEERHHDTEEWKERLRASLAAFERKEE